MWGELCKKLRLSGLTILGILSKAYALLVVGIVMQGECIRDLVGINILC